MITAMCAGGSAGFVPPGIYKVTQTQSSNNPIFTIPSGCAGAGNGFYIFGLGSRDKAAHSFRRPESLSPTEQALALVLFSNLTIRFSQTALDLHASLT